MYTEQRLAQRCRAFLCLRRTGLRCFDCERPYCARHLTRLRIPLLTDGRCFLVCRRCLRAYADELLLGQIVTLDD